MHLLSPAAKVKTMNNYTQDELAQRAQLRGLCDLLDANRDAPFLLITPGKQYTEVESGVIGRSPLVAGCLMAVPVTHYRRFRISESDGSEFEVTTPRAEVIVAPQDSRYLAVGSAIVQALKNMNLGHLVSRFYLR